MGRKAKIKKMRREGSIKNIDSKSEKNNFINEIERQGYQFDKALEGPEIPEKNIDPQL